MSTAAASACAATMIGLLHSFRKHLHKPPVTLPFSQKNQLQPPVKLPCSPFHPSSIYFNSPTYKYPFFPMAVSPLITTRNPSSTTIPPRAKHRSSRKVNIRCRFGGKLLPRLSDGALHYVGGRTRITDFRRDRTLQELYCKMEDINGGPVSICYKLPDQNLDSLVSISSVVDLYTMLDEYDYLKEASSCKYPRIHVFLFPLSNRDNSLAEFNDVACNDRGLSYIKEVNGAIKVCWGAPTTTCFITELARLEQNQLTDALSCFEEAFVVLAHNQKLHDQCNGRDGKALSPSWLFTSSRKALD